MDATNVENVECEAYCNNMLVNCGSEFTDRATCMSACAAYPDGNPNAFSGNSRQCRLCKASAAPASAND